MGNLEVTVNHPVFSEEFGGWLSLVGCLAVQGPLGLITAALHQWTGSLVPAVLRSVA